VFDCPYCKLDIQSGFGTSRFARYWFGSRQAGKPGTPIGKRDRGTAARDGRATKADFRAAAGTSDVEAENGRTAAGDIWFPQQWISRVSQCNPDFAEAHFTV